MKVTANAQVFQPIYIDSDAKDSNDKIVLIEEMAESLPEATGVLNSLFKEKYYGMVATGSTISLANFRAKLFDVDREQNIGELEISELLKKIVDICYECKCEMIYYKGPSLYEDIPEDLKNIAVAIDLAEIAKKGKEITKDVWTKILSKDSNTDKQLNNMKASEYKNLIKFLEKDEKSYKELQKALKDTQKIDTNNILNEMLHEIEIDEELGTYLGQNYNKLSFYVVKSNKLDVTIIMDEITDMYLATLPVLENKVIKEIPKGATKLEREAIEKSNKKIKDLDETARKMMIDAESNIVAIGLDDKNRRFLVACRKPISKGILAMNDNWPKKPDTNVTIQDIKNCIWSDESFPPMETIIKRQESKTL